MKKSIMTLLLLCVSAASARGQTIHVKLTCGNDEECKEKWYTQPNQKFLYEKLPVRHRTADKAFIIWEAIAQVATIADAENSLYVLRSTPGTQEANPIFGKSPSRLRYYAIMEGLYLVEIPISFHYKREDDALKAAGFTGHKYAKWWILPMLTTASHGLGIGITLSGTGR